MPGRPVLRLPKGTPRNRDPAGRGRNQELRIMATEFASAADNRTAREPRPPSWLQVLSIWLK